jgi:hypothetical protein
MKEPSASDGYTIDEPINIVLFVIHTKKGFSWNRINIYFSLAKKQKIINVKNRPLTLHIQVEV